jgi:protein-disulfide isomerase
VPYEQFQSTIEKALAGKNPPPTPTALPQGVAPYDADPGRPGFTYDGSPTLGDAKAPLVLIEFMDFQCGDCARFVKEVQPSLQDKYVQPGQMRLVMKYLPTRAPEAATAAQCAARQGKFWDYYKLLFDKQSEWQPGNKDQLLAYAKSLGLDETKLQQCLSDETVQQTIDADQELAQQLGIQAPPYFLLLNVKQQAGVRIPGLPTMSQMEQQIQKVSAPPPTGTPAPTP